MLGDSFGAAIVEHFSKKELAALSPPSETNGKIHRNSTGYSAETVVIEERL